MIELLFNHFHLLSASEGFFVGCIVGSTMGLIAACS